MGTDEGLGSLHTVLVKLDPKPVYPALSNLVLILDVFILPIALSLFLFFYVHVRLLTVLLDRHVERVSRRTVCRAILQFLN